MVALSVTKIVRLAHPAPLFNVGCNFACSFLVSTAWHRFFRLGTTLSQGNGGILVFLSKSNIVLGLFYKNIASHNDFLSLIATKLVNSRRLKVNLTNFVVVHKNIALMFYLFVMVFSHRGFWLGDF